MFEKVKEMIVEQLSVEEDAVTLEARFKEDLDADSLDLFEMVMAAEEEYGIEIPSEDLEGIATVGDFVKYLEAHVEQYKNDAKPDNCYGAAVELRIK